MIELEPEDRPTIEQVIESLLQLKNKIIQDLFEYKIHNFEELKENKQKIQEIEQELGIKMEQQVIDLEENLRNTYIDEQQNVTKEDFENDHDIYQTYIKNEIEAFNTKNDYDTLYDFLQSEQSFIQKYFKDRDEVETIDVFIRDMMKEMFEYKFLKMNVPLIYPLSILPVFNLSYLRLLEKEIEQDFEKIQQKIATTEEPLKDSFTHKDMPFFISPKIKTSMEKESTKLTLHRLKESFI